MEPRRERSAGGGSGGDRYRGNGRGVGHGRSVWRTGCNRSTRPSSRPPSAGPGHRAPASRRTRRTPPAARPGGRGRRGPSRAAQPVCQWIGTAARGRFRRSDSAARSGSMCSPRPSVWAPAPDRQQRDIQIGPRAVIPSNRSVSPAKYTLCDPRTTKPMAGAVDRPGRRSPSAAPARRRCPRRRSRGSPRRRSRSPG